MSYQIIIEKSEYDRLKKKTDRSSRPRKIISFRKFWKPDIDDIVKKVLNEYRDWIVEFDHTHSHKFGLVHDVLVSANKSIHLICEVFETIPDESTFETRYVPLTWGETIDMIQLTENSIKRKCWKTK